MSPKLFGIIISDTIGEIFVKIHNQDNKKDEIWGYFQI